MLSAFDTRNGLPIHIDKVNFETKNDYSLVCFECHGVVYMKDDGVTPKELIHKDSRCMKDIPARDKLVEYIQSKGKLHITCGKCKKVTVLNLQGCTIQLDKVIGKTTNDIVCMSSHKRYIFNFKHVHTPTPEYYTFKSNETFSSKLIDHKRCTHLLQKMSQLATELGYCDIDSEWDNPHRRIAIMCKPIETYQLKKTWHLTFPREDQRHPLWVESWIDFLKRKCCLKCALPYPTRLSRPYCDKCRKMISLHAEEITYVPLSRNILNTFERYFKWLKRLPTVEDNYGVCTKCSKKTPYIWHYGHRPICCQCVVLNHQSHFPHEGYFSSKSDNLHHILSKYHEEPADC